MAPVRPPMAHTGLDAEELFVDTEMSTGAGCRSGKPVAAASSQGRPLTRANLRTPKAAAIAGILFSVHLAFAFCLLRIALPADPREPGAWLNTNSELVGLALNLVPFAGIAFLWFIAVLRDRLGELEDRFFATVFFGSGLLFLGMLFTAAAIVGAIVIAFSAQPEQLINSATFHYARAAAYGIVNIYMIKMAGVFMITTSTIALHTAFAPRWMALLGYAVSLFLLFFSYYISWSFLLFPLWVFLISVYILSDDLPPGMSKPAVQERSMGC
jgi:hypothetical protein